MDIRVWEFSPSGLDKFINELVVLFAPCARLAQAQVEIVVE